MKYEVREPPADWITTGELAKLINGSRKVVKRLVMKIVEKEGVKGRVIKWKKNYYYSPKLVDRILALERGGLQRAKAKPMGWYGTREAAQTFGVPASTISSAAKRGDVRAVKVGTRIFVEPRSMERFAEIWYAKKRRLRGWIRRQSAVRAYDVSSAKIDRWVRIGVLPVRRPDRGAVFVHEETLRELVEGGKYDGYKVLDEPPEWAIPVSEVMEKTGAKALTIYRIARKNELFYGPVKTGKGMRGYVDHRVVELIPPRMPETGWITTTEAREKYGRAAVEQAKRYGRRMVRDDGRVVFAIPEAMLQVVRKAG